MDFPSPFTFAEPESTWFTPIPMSPRAQAVQRSSDTSSSALDEGSDDYTRF